MVLLTKELEGRLITGMTPSGIAAKQLSSIYALSYPVACAAVWAPAEVSSNGNVASITL